MRASGRRPAWSSPLITPADWNWPVHDGMNVLEIGTGTGYTAAPLCERLGSQHVSTVDIDPELTEAARRRLADAGYRPAVITGDGLLGDPAHAPFDRVLATVATERVPYAWVEQTRVGGVILADVRPRGMTWAGALARLTVTGDGTAGGPLIPATWGFMSTRREVDRPGIPEAAPIDTSVVRTRTSPVGGAALRTPGLSLLIWQRLPGITVFPRPDGAQIVTPDASWATVTTTAPATVEHGGPTDLWQQVEEAHAWWTAHNAPGGEALPALTQRLHHQTPDGKP
ncbi:UNVERIFIED_ORG: protein-L-isoaspartate(D-aspartate) O-methyltransferase (PCMT) [Actinomadura viridilutea]